MVDSRVTLRGVAHDALGGAVVADAEGEWLVYLDGLESWDEAMLGTDVEVAGLLVRDRIAPEATVRDGSHSHGAGGMALIMREPTWRPVS
jgi:hypothetical protein